MGTGRDSAINTRAREALAAGYVSGGTSWRNLDWVAPHVDLRSVREEEALLLADAQTSGGLLVAGEIPGAPVIGELVPRGQHTMWCGNDSLDRAVDRRHVDHALLDSPHAGDGAVLARLHHMLQCLAQRLR